MSSSDKQQLNVPTISVVIPTRNRLAFLKEAFASVAAQDYENRETIVIDDASEDGTWNWLSAQSNSKVRIFRNQTHAERSASRNLGLAKAKGEFILFLDDDDLLAPGALSYLSHALQKSPEAVASVGARIYFDERGHCRRPSHPRWQFTKCVWADVLFGWAPGQGQALLRKSQLRTAGSWNQGLSIAEDHELWIRLSREQPAVILPRTVLKVRIHAGQTSLVGFGKKQVNQIKLGLLDQLDPEMQTRGRLLHEAYRRFKVAQKAFHLHRHKTAFVYYLAAIRMAPVQAWSPLTGSDLIGGLVKSAVCMVQPPALTSLIRRLKLRWRSIGSPRVVSSPGESTVAR